jgi:lipoprotein-anchoring transpeptidase ErfK/SrfK
MPPRHFNVTSPLAARLTARPEPVVRAGRRTRALLLCAALALGTTTTSPAFEPAMKLPDDPLTLASSSLPATTLSAEPATAVQAVTSAAQAETAEHVEGPAAQAVIVATAGPPEKPEPATPATPPWGPVQIVVYKGKRSLALYRFGNFYREYPVVLGLNPEGRKRHANDARTPEGLYHVVRKRPHERWQYFLDIDYPNDRDRRIYAEEKNAGHIPDEDGSPFAIGGSIGIHGNDRADQQAAGIDWTKGCIALDPADIAEIEALTPVGTPVWIVR